MTEAAKGVFASFIDEMFDAKIAARKDELDSLFVRPHENALKFALIRACAVCVPSDVPQPEIQESDARWAVDLARSTTHHMAMIAKENIHNSEFQRRIAVFRKVIRSAGAAGVTPRDMKRRHKPCQLPSRDFDAVISHLELAGEIKTMNTNAGRRSKAGTPVKARNAYVLIEYLSKESGEEDE
jgi:hypothetical protein